VTTGLRILTNLFCLRRCGRRVSQRKEVPIPQGLINTTCFGDKRFRACPGLCPSMVSPASTILRGPARSLRFSQATVMLLMQSEPTV
jgi:hypothetical protein